MTNTQSPTAPLAADDFRALIAASPYEMTDEFMLSTIVSLGDVEAIEVVWNEGDDDTVARAYVLAEDGDRLNAITLDELRAMLTAEVPAEPGGARVVLNTYVTPSTGLFPASLATDADTLFDLSLHA